MVSTENLGSVHIFCDHRGGGKFLKYLCMIMREGEGELPYLCHSNSFYLFSTRSIICYFVKAYNMFFISDVSLIDINVNNYKDNIIF